VERFMIEHELRKALLNEEFELHYQPRVDLETGLVTSVEALIRWNHPVRGRVSPDQFIPVAEETGLIVPLGKWVMKTACQQAKVWQRDCDIPLSVSVNLSTLQLQSHKLQETVREALAESGLAGKYLELEITESSLMQDITSVIRILNDLKEFGISISVDDFGTGYSSLKYLQLLPVDALKIDKSFIQAIESESSTAIPRSIIQLAHALNMKVVAEGVETKEQLTFCNDNGCDEIQGYFISKPLSVQEMNKYLQKELNPSR
ncbi:MAG TPA: EAL domain-containing protein, partial [Bacillota bacterium]|nr:EAL domain-containing protein [Bacillota bacterium]